MKLEKILLISAILMFSAIISYKTAARPINTPLPTSYVAATFDSFTNASRFCAIVSITCYGFPQYVNDSTWIVYYNPGMDPSPNDPEDEL